MFKKIQLMFIVLCVTFFMSGCMKYSTTMELTENDELIFNNYVGFKFEFFKKIDPNFDPDDPFKNMQPPQEDENSKKTEEEFKKKGYKIDKYKDDDSFGLRISKTFKDLHTMKKDDFFGGYVSTNDSSPITIKKNSFKTTYIVNLRFDPEKATKEYGKLSGNNANEQPVQPNEQMNNEQGEPQTYYEGTSDGVEDSYVNDAKDFVEDYAKKMFAEIKPTYDLKIKIPKNMKVIKHNATSVDEKNCEYIWDFTTMPQLKEKIPIDIELEFYKINYFSTVILIITILITIIVIAKNREYVNMTNR